MHIKGLKINIKNHHWKTIINTEMIYLFVSYFYQFLTLVKGTFLYRSVDGVISPFLFFFFISFFVTDVARKTGRENLYIEHTLKLHWRKKYVEKMFGS